MPAATTCMWISCPTWNPGARLYHRPGRKLCRRIGGGGSMKTGKPQWSLALCRIAPKQSCSRQCPLPLRRHRAYRILSRASTASAINGPHAPPSITLLSQQTQSRTPQTHTHLNKTGSERPASTPPSTLLQLSFFLAFVVLIRI